MPDYQHFLAVGSYANQDDPGIYIYTFDPHTAELSPVTSFTGIENPSFLAISHDGGHLYTVSETMNSGSDIGGSVAAFSFQPGSGQLTLLNQQLTFGGAPCYLTLDPTNSWLLVANYMGGNINLFPLLPDGTIGTMAANVQHYGHGPNPTRQEAPHPHSIPLDASGTYAFVPDLGLDTIFLYKLDHTDGRLPLHAEIQLEPGSGPRHLAFHPSAHFIYSINELDSTITTFAFDLSQGHLQPLQTISTLPADFSGENTCADIHLSPDGRFLYGSNRGDDSLAVFLVGPENGTLSLIEHVSTQGKTPRNFALSPDGRFLLVGNQDSNSLVTYTVDPVSGRLTPEQTLTISQPVCLKFFAPLQSQ